MNARHDCSIIMDLMVHSVDLHVHAAPDMVHRICDDLQCGRAAASLGMAGIVLKNHYAPTMAQAEDVNNALNQRRLFGSVTLNHYVGGLNPYAVEAALGMGAKVVWLPTRHASNHIANEMPAKCLFVPDRELKRAAGLTVQNNGKLLPELMEIIKLVAEADACLMTGHISPAEAKAVCETAIGHGVRRIVLTHPDFSLTAVPVAIQAELAKKGVFIEKTMFTLFSGIISAEEMLSGVKQIGIEHCFFATDFGMQGFPLPWLGMMKCVEMLLEYGFNESAIQQLTGRTPRFLLGIDEE